MEELYFCLHLTENEHYIVADDLRNECDRLGLEMKYYRKLKDGHVPMHRETKIVGDRLKINLLKKYMHENFIDEQAVRNPYANPQETKS